MRTWQSSLVETSGSAANPSSASSTSDGHWEINCGGYEHEDDNEILILHKAHLVARDPTLEPTLDLPEGWEARRETFSADWVREPQTAE